MAEYADESVLLSALDRKDFRTIKKCLKAGQDFNTIIIDHLPLLLDTITRRNSIRFLSLMACKEYLDLNIFGHVNDNAFDFAIGAEFPYVHLLLQAGAKPVMGWFQGACSGWLDNRPRAITDYCILLSAGLDPGDIIPREVIRKEVRRWLEGFDSAKQLLGRIFDNVELEKEILNFVYNEEHLRKIA